jgi:hypothetical protein
MKKMSQANEKEFEELASYVNFYATHVWHVPSDAREHPSHFLTPVPGKVTKSQLLAGLRQAANDTVEDAAHLTAEEITALDDACRANDVLTLSEVRRRFSRQYGSVLKKQRISNDTEYYLVVGIINDLTIRLSNDERSMLEQLAQAYEETGKSK